MTSFLSLVINGSDRRFPSISEAIFKLQEVRFNKLPRQDRPDHGDYKRQEFAIHSFGCRKKYANHIANYERERVIQVNSIADLAQIRKGKIVENLEYHRVFRLPQTEHEYGNTYCT